MSTAAPQPQRITCPHCQASVKAPSLPAGTSVGCPRCGQAFILGAAAPPSPAAPPAAPPRSTAAASAAPSQLARHRPATQAGQPSPSQQASRPQPAPRPVANKAPDPVVDPMQQPIQRAARPKAKTEHTEFAITCKLCGSRVYARPEQAGQQIKCPDCHSPVDVVAPKQKAVAKGPSLDDAEEVPMSNPGNRPRYRPMVRPEGEDAILGLLNDPPFEVSPSQPASVGSAARATSSGNAANFPPVGRDPKPAASKPRSAAPQTADYADQVSAGDEDEDDFELRLSDPVERPEVRVELPHHLAADLPDPRDEGSYGDELWGGGPDDGKPRWQKSPFLVGIFGFLLQQATLGNWIGHSVAAGGLLCLLQLAIQFSQGGTQQVAGLLLSIMFTVLAIGWGAAFAAACLAVIQDTANGNEAVEDWPDWHIFEWFVRAFTIATAAFVAAFPGMLIASTILTSGGPLIAAPLPVLASLIAFFPVTLTSVLVEGSILAVVSPTVLRMIRAAPEGWILYYMLTFLIGMLAIGALALTEMQNFVASFAAGVISVTLILLYTRLLGRLMWYSQHKLTEAELREENQRRWAERATHS